MCICMSVHLFQLCSTVSATERRKGNSLSSWDLQFVGEEGSSNCGTDMFAKHATHIPNHNTGLAHSWKKLREKYSVKCHRKKSLKTWNIKRLVWDCQLTCDSNVSILLHSKQGSIYFCP